MQTSLSGVDVLEVTASIQIDESELEERFIRAPGPGGQHVNKAATAVQLRFDAQNSPALSEAVRARLRRIAGRRITGEGVIVIEASRYRSQERNRQDARRRLADLLRRAARPPRTRRATRPPAGAVERRLRAKRKRGEVKRTRRRPSPED